MDEVINEAFASGKPTAIVIVINQSDESRDAEYTPWPNEDIHNAHGEKFADWVTTDLKNWIDKNYRTKTDAQFATIGGISRSGMMAYYMIMAHPDVFGNALVMSPSMRVDYEKLFSKELNQKRLEKKIHISVGEYEGREMIPAAEVIF